MEFIGVFGQYDFAIRDAIVLCLVALAVYVLLNAGIFAVPQVGLMAIGSYTSAMVSLYAGMPFAVALVCGGLAGMVCGLILAVLLGRLNGIYLAIATIAFSEVVAAAILIIPGTGGSQGLVAIPRDANDFFIAGTLAMAVAAILLINRSRFGLAIVAMREDRLMASHQGINIFAYRVSLFGLAGLLSGLAGGLSVHMSGFVEPGQFSFDLLTQLISMVVLGGMTYVMGPLIGAIIILGLPHLYTGLNDYQVMLNGLLIVLVISFAPKGMIGAAVGWLRKRGNAAQTGRAVASGSTEVSSVPDLNDPLIAGTGPLGGSMSPRETLASEPAVSVTDINVSFGGNRALRDAAIEVHEGELLGLIGPNGSGKTTMLNVISGIYRPDSGSGNLMGEPIARFWGQPHKLSRKGISRTFQTIRLIDDHTVLDNVLIGMSHSGDRAPAHQDSVAHRYGAARTVLARLGLSEIADVQAGWLPYGVRRKVEIARAVVSDPRVLLLDEPTAGMNAEETSEIFRIIALLRNAGMAVIIVEHDVDMMARYCDRLVVLNFGSVLAAGVPVTVLQNREVVSAYVGGTA
jgi:branched-chain amino acid transport system permease protein